MSQVYWLEQLEADLPAHNDWLSVGEAACLETMRIPKRRADWRLGRWTAKLAVAAYRRLPADLHSLSQIEIRPAPSGAPEVFLCGQPAPISISLSHRSGTALCALAESGVRLGCDLEAVEPRSPAFVTDYFTAGEQKLIEHASAAERPQLVTLLWSAKESALKAIAEGLRLDTRDVTVNPAGVLEDREKSSCLLSKGALREPVEWFPLEARCKDGQVFEGWWWHVGGLLRTLVASPASSPPVRLEIPRTA